MLLNWSWTFLGHIMCFRSMTIATVARKGNKEYLEGNRKVNNATKNVVAPQKSLKKVVRPHNYMGRMVWGESTPALGSVQRRFEQRALQVESVLVRR